jgi:prepilin-type N-terminal cleavage/methylation domain-containing protein
MRIERRTGAGFTLTELLVVVLLLGAFIIMSSQVFIVSSRAATESRKRLSLVQRVEGAVGAMRRDVWSAGSIKADGDRVEMVLAEGQVVTWVSAKGVLTRSDKGGTRSWRELPAAAFESAGPTLTLRLDAGGKAERLTLMSQRMLAEGGR